MLLKPLPEPVDRAGVVLMSQDKLSHGYRAMRQVALTPEEIHIWSDDVIDYTFNGVVGCHFPPIGEKHKTELQLKGILILSSNRLTLLSRWIGGQQLSYKERSEFVIGHFVVNFTVPLSHVQEIIISDYSDVLCILSIKGKPDLILEITHRLGKKYFEILDK